MKKSLIFALILSFVLPMNCLALNLQKDSEFDISSEMMGIAGSDGFGSFPFYNNSGKQIGVSFYGFSEKNGEYFQDVYNVFYDNRVVHSSFSTSNWLIDASTVNKDDNPDVKGESDVMFTLYDSSHNPVKTFLYGGNGVDDASDYEDYGIAFFSCDENNNLDGYIFTIYTESTDIAGVVPGYVTIKIDLEGNIVWQKNKLPANKSFSADGKIYFQVNGQILNRYELYMDKPRSEVWSVDTGVYLDDDTCIVSYNKTGVVDGVVVLSSGTVGKNIVMIKYDLNGKEIFRKELIDVVYGTQLSMSRYIDGNYDGYLLISNANSRGYGAATILKYDLNGNFIWKDEYKLTEYGGILSVSTEMVDSNGNFNSYLVLARQNNCPAPYWRKVENEKFFKSSPIVKKLDNSDDDCFDYKIFKYAYPSYEVVKDNNENGDITISNDKAYPGEVVRISATPKEGYSLKRIVVIDESGKEIEVRDDGTFIMPEGKVTVTALYNRISNPETVSACYVVLGIILAISIGTLIVIRKKENV